MALRYYDDAIIYKLKKWIPSNSRLRVLRPNESKRLFELKADDEGDKPFRLPFIALSRNDDIELQINIKNSRSYDGLNMGTSEDGKSTAQWNQIPVRMQYQLDIYTKTSDDGEEYMRNFLFKLINNPLIKIGVPYNGMNLEHVAYIRVLDTVSNTSDVSERLFEGQFTRWTIQFELHDAFLFSVPYRKNWTIEGVTVEVAQDFINEPDETWTEELPAEGGEEANAE